MRRPAFIVIVLLLALAGFHVWHTPLRGPLSDTEIDRFLSTQQETGGAAWTDAEAFEAFLRADDGRPFVMINLMEVRDVAAYPADFASEAAAGVDAERAYGQAVLPLLLARGSYPIARAERHQTIINSVGEDAANFDSLALVRYRSRRDLIDMISSEPFLSAELHKWASLENTLVAPARATTSFQLLGFLPFIPLLFAAGMLAQAVLQARSNRTQENSDARFSD